MILEQAVDYKDSASEMARDLMKCMIEKNVSRRLTAD
jgi:serine/threonine protein kinase